MFSATKVNPPPPGIALFVKSGSVLYFAAYSKWQNKWFHQHNGTETECDPPDYWWDDAKDTSDQPLRSEVELQLRFF